MQRCFRGPCGAFSSGLVKDEVLNVCALRAWGLGLRLKNGASGFASRQCTSYVQPKPCLRLVVVIFLSNVMMSEPWLLLVFGHLTSAYTFALADPILTTKILPATTSNTETISGPDHKA